MSTGGHAARAAVVELLTLMGGAMRERGDLRRAGAYLRAANSVARAPDFEAKLKTGRLRDIPGIGPSIEKTIQAFDATGEKPDWIAEGATRLHAGGAGVEVEEIPPWFHGAPFADAPDLHCHTTWSDGSLTIDEVAVFAKRLGAKAIGISDHSGSLGIARGLKPPEVLLQWADVERVRAAHPDLRILRGTECDVLRDGRLDHPEELLAGFDYVIGSLHSQLKLPKKEQTERVLAALDSPHLTILGHPTTAVPGRREPANLDLGAIFEKAAKRGVAMEVNGNPGRLDLPVTLAKKALAAGCKLSLGSDGHSAWEMLHVAKAKRMAAEAGATEKDIVNYRFLPGAEDPWTKAA
jgi:histidinol phosphatase-like PHP family hydrolase